MALFSSPRMDDLNCNNQCRWYHGFFDRAITGSLSFSRVEECDCVRANASIGSAPYYTTDHPFVGPPTVPPDPLSQALCCKEGPAVPLASCTATGLCHANTYENAKPFDTNATWAESYTTPFVCVLPISTSRFPESWQMPAAVHAACMQDGDAAADSRCRQWRAELLAAGTEVLHCGKCSACSTRHDLEVLNRTKDFITERTTACSTRFVAQEWWTVNDLSACLVAAGIDFSTDPALAWAQPTDKPTCMDAWTDNVVSDATLCKSFCYTKFVNSTNTGDFARDQCLQCDEYSSGPAFIKTAGANRRSTGIQSDINRAQLRGTPWEQKVCKVGFFSGARDSRGSIAGR